MGMSKIFVGPPTVPGSLMLPTRDTNDKNELYTSEPNGLNNVKVSGTLLASRDVEDFRWAPDSSRIAYIANQDSDDTYELYTSYPTTPSGNVKVSGTLVSGGQLSDYGWAPDSSRIAYIADQDTDETTELYTSEPDGSNNVKVSGTMVSGGEIDTDDSNPVFLGARTVPSSSTWQIRIRMICTRFTLLIQQHPQGNIKIKRGPEHRRGGARPFNGRRDVVGFLMSR